MPFFKEEKDEKPEKKDKLILDPNELYSAYEVLMSKAKQTKEESGQFLLPKVGTLYTTKETRGRFDEMSEMIEKFRIDRISIGIKMNQLIDICKDALWAYDSYITKADGYIFEGFGTICESSFIIIDRLYSTIRGLRKDIELLNEIVLRLKAEPLTQNEMKNLDNLFNKKFAEYEIEYLKGNKNTEKALRESIENMGKDKRENAYIQFLFMSRVRQMLNEIVERQEASAEENTEEKERKEEPVVEAEEDDSVFGNAGKK